MRRVHPSFHWEDLGGQRRPCGSEQQAEPRMDPEQQQRFIIRPYVGESGLNHLSLQLRPVSVFHSSFSMKGGRLLLTSALHSRAPHTRARARVRTVAKRMKE